MVLSGDMEDRAEHPYWFARIIGISGPLLTSSKSQKFDFLFVRWFGQVSEQRRYGIHVNRMPKIGFINARNSEAFGFINPSNVIHAAHIIPAFDHGTTDQFLIGRSVVRQDRNRDTDFFRYYVNM